MKQKKLLLITFIVFLLSTTFLLSDARPEWKAFGKKYKNKYTNDPEKKAKYLAGLVGEAMEQMKILPNGDALGRARAFRQHGNQAAGNCGDIAEIMRAVFKGAGFKDHQIFKIEVEKEGLNRIKGGWLFDVNLNHTVFGVVVNKKVIVFEQWAYGGNNGTFKDFYKSIWNGMDLNIWLDTMKKHNYSAYSFGERFKRININNIYTYLRKNELIKSGRIPEKRPRRIQEGTQDETTQVLAEFRSLYLRWLKETGAPGAKYKVTHNASKIGPNLYRVASETWRKAEEGRLKGKFYRSGSGDWNMDFSQIKAAVVKYKKDLGIN